MGRTFEALRRAERERLAHRAAASGDEGSPRALWRRWLGRPDPDGRDEAELAAWLVAETRSLGARVDAFDEKLDKKLPEIEGRMLRVLESASEHLETTLADRTRATLAEELSTRLADLERRLALGAAALAAVLLAVLVTLALGD